MGYVRPNALDPFSKRVLLAGQTEAPKYFPRKELKELSLWFDL